MNGIVIHCSDSPQGRGDNASVIDRWHKERGWSGIGYHYVILEDGTVEKGRNLGKSGAHTKGYNHYVGICLIGQGSYTEEQYKSLSSLIKDLVLMFDISEENIFGHNKVAPKACPMFDWKEFLVKEGIIQE